MQPVEISSAAHNLAKAALADHFNDYLRDASQYFGADAFKIDFDGLQEKRSFYEGNIKRDTLISEFKPQLGTCVLSALAGECTNDQKGRTWSGPVEVLLEFHIRSKGADYDPKLNALLHAVVSAVTECFNAGTIGNDLVFYGGQIKFTVGEQEFFREFWLQSVTFQVLFEVHT